MMEVHIFLSPSTQGKTQSVSIILVLFILLFKMVVDENEKQVISKLNS